NIEPKQPLDRLNRSGLFQDRAELSWSREAKHVRCVWRQWNRSDVAVEGPRHDVLKRIAILEGPNGECGAPSRFQNAQDFPNCPERIREEHGGEPTRDRVECIGWKRKVIRRADFKLHGVELFICGDAASSCDHLPGWMDGAETG